MPLLIGCLLVTGIGRYRLFYFLRAETVRCSAIVGDIDLIKVNPKVDVYNAESSEILLFDDGIQVKGQKSQREPKAKPEEKFGSKSANKSQIQRVVTDIAMLQKTNQKFEYITAPIAQQGQDMLPFSCSGKSPDN